MPFTTDADVLARLRARLDPLEQAGVMAAAPARSDYDLNPAFRPEVGEALKPAAVLAPIVARPEGLMLLLTQRTADMPTHAGQVAFPGGRIAAGEDAAAAALRETQEETGIAPGFIELLGAFEAYQTVTGYAVSPIVGLVRPGFSLTPDPREVALVFEAPLSFVFDPANHQRHTRTWSVEGREQQRHFYVMPYQDHYIWGATAGMIRALYLRLYGETPG
jgi:8-oxo-dGTP pyrophosphatase MutT (NUDIX family)